MLSSARCDWHPPGLPSFNTPALPLNSEAVRRLSTHQWVSIAACLQKCFCTPQMTDASQRLARRTPSSSSRGRLDNHALAAWATRPFSHRSRTTSTSPDRHNRPLKRPSHRNLQSLKRVSCRRYRVYHHVPSTEWRDTAKLAALRSQSRSDQEKYPFSQVSFPVA